MVKKISIEIFNSTYHYILNIDKRLSVISGDSSTGKTMITEVLKNKDTKCISSHSIVSIDTDVQYEVSMKNSVIIVDLDSVNDFKTVTNLLSIITPENNNYIILLGRKYLRNIPIPINALYDLKVIRGVTKNVRRYDSEIISLTNQKIKIVISEDSKSGYQFMKQCFTNVISLNGASNYRRTVCNDSLMFIDALGFGGYIEAFLDDISRKNNVQYILWKSFEYFLCKSLFGFVEDLDGVNLEEEYVKKLNYLTNGHYGKSTGCCGTFCSTCKNDCKHFNCLKVLLTAYPELKDKTDVVATNNTLQQIINKMSGE